MKCSYERLWHKLEKANITKTDFQKRIGISADIMSRIESNEDITITELGKIMQYLHCSFDDIVQFVSDSGESVFPHRCDGLRLATVFSGIGAVEHALDRMQIKHKIIFACDNGDIDILSQKVPNNLQKIEEEFIGLKKTISCIQVQSKEDSEHKSSLENDLHNTEYKFTEAKNKINFFEIAEIDALLCSILQKITEMKSIKKTRKNEYLSFSKSLSEVHGENRKLLVLQIMLNVINDFSKDNSISTLSEIFPVEISFSSRDSIDWNAIYEDFSRSYFLFESISGKKIIKAFSDIAERLSMLHERITTFHITKKLALLDDYKEKKAYIDSLYQNQKSHNKVRESYLANYPLNDEHFHWNVSFLDGKQYFEQVDLFVGGSPCQSFSLVGKQRGLEDTRGTLFYEYARLIQEIRPKIFIYENVKAVLSNDFGRTWETMKNVFTSLGYNWKHAVLNAKDYGIPQNRERLFVVGFRNDLKLVCPFNFPNPIPLKKTMQDFLIDNVSGQYYLPQKGVDFVTMEKNLEKRYTQIDGDVQLCQKKNQQFNWHGDFVFVEEEKAKTDIIKDLDKYFLSEKVIKYVLATGTKGFYSRPQTDLKIARPLLTTMHKMHRAGVDNYVTTAGRLRKLTPRECLRLMGFCDSFKIVVSDTSIYQQSGNSIVVDVLISILHQIFESYPSILKGE